jgi:hypothetical protein
VRFFIAVLVLILSLQSLIKADDIRDFEIEGMSINDTLLQVYNQKIISKSEVSMYDKENKFTAVAIVDDSYKTYSQVDIEYLTQDKNILIKSLNGIIYYSDMNKCYEKMNDITKEISNTVSVIPQTNTYKHQADPLSSIRGTMYQLENGQILIQCYDYSSDNFGEDLLSVSIWSEDYVKFLDTNPY